MAITYYYPEGPFGPICDIFIDDADDGLREVEPDDGDGRVPTYGPIDYGGIESVIPDTLPFLTSRRCKVRTLADGTEEYYDCVDDLTSPIGAPADFPLIVPQYDWETISTTWGIEDDFEPLKITPEMCSPADPDVNIIPVKFFRADGTFVEKTQVERSNPVTFPVTDGTPSTIVSRILNAEFVEIGGGLSAFFLADGTGIQVDGTGTGTITIDFEWDDSPSISGQSVGTVTIGGQTFSQGSSGSGNQTRAFSVTGGNSYLFNFSGQSADAGFIVSDDGQSIQWDDDATNGFDLNSTLSIRSLTGAGGSVVLRATGTENFTSQIGLTLEWDDNPNTNGSALGTVVINGQTFTQRGSKGSQDMEISVTTNTDYPLTIDGGAGEGGSNNNQDVSYPITIAANGDKGRGDFAVVKSVSNDTIKFTDASFQMDTDSEFKIKSTSSGVSARFRGSDEDDLELVVTGDGTVTLEFEWDDDTNTNGKSVGELYIDGQTIDQSGDEGEEEITINVGSSGSGGTGVSGSGLGGYEVSSNSICFYDLDGTDCNATLRITGFVPAESEPGPGAWNDDADLYAVWVNPEVCTLPTLQQTVTYFIDIPDTGNYTITGGADDEFQVYLNDSTTPVIGGPAGIFEPSHEIHHTGKYTPPYSATVPLTKGTLKMVVTCTNGSTENDEDGNPTGNAFKWYYNPGGWYIKICRGNKCIESTSIDWVHSGPNGEGQWGEFMDKYAVYPSNSDVLLNVDHSATYNILIPAAGDYILQWGMDDVGTISLDGTQIVSSGYEPNSQTYVISNLTAGPHTIGVTIRNNGPKGDWIANPGGIAWTLTPKTGPGEGSSDIDWTISGQNSDAGYQIKNNGQRIIWDDNASNGFDENARMDIGKVTQLMGSNIGVSFSADGTGLDVTGSGEADVRLDFSWDDSPSISGLAVGTLTIAGETFSQTTSSESETFAIRIAANGDKGRGDTAAVKDVSDKKIKFTDSTDQMDTDSELKIKSTSPGVSANFTGSNDNNLELVTTGQGTVTLEFEWDDDRNRNGKSVGELYIDGQTIDQSGDEGDETITINVSSGQSSQNKTIRVSRYGPTAGIIASSLDLQEQTTEGNLIWHTRKATGYKYVEIT